MKFVINRVHHESVWSNSKTITSGLEIELLTVASSKRRNNYCVGRFYCFAMTNEHLFCNGFTIAEIDDEGYLM